MKKIYLFNLLLLLYCVKGFSQGENNHWYFGKRAGIRFANGAETVTPTVLTDGVMSNQRTDLGCDYWGGSMLHNELDEGGSAVVSKADGSLLFYTDGKRVYNKLHQEMAGSQPLYPDSGEESKQSAVIFQHPGNLNQYYVISSSVPVIMSSLDQWGYWISVVDFSTNANGQIISANQYFGDHYCEGAQAVTVTSNLNGDGFWVLIPMKQRYCGLPGDVVLLPDSLAAFKVDNSGISNMPTVVNLLDYKMGFYSEVKVSLHSAMPKVCISGSERIFDSSGMLSPKLKVYSFDRATGQISGTSLLSRDLTVLSTEFSSDENLLYAIVDVNNNPANRAFRLVVFDLNNPSATYRILSNIEVVGSLQRAIDGNIYFTNKTNVLYKIANQNSFSTAAISTTNINLGTSVYGPRCTYFGLPQLIPVMGQVNDCLSVPTLTLSSPGNDMTNNTVPVAQTLREKSDWIKASNVINVGNALVGDGVVYHAGNYVELNPGFEAVTGSQFAAYIEGCSGDFVYRTADDDSDVKYELNTVANKIKLYPNPTNNYITVDYTVGFNQVRITSIDGKTVFNQKSDISNSKQIDVSNLKNGIYTLSIVTTEGATLTEKLIKN